MNKEEETLPKKVNYLLEKGKLIDNEWKVDVYLHCKDYKDSEYDDQLEWLMCNRVVSPKYYENDFESFICPDDKKTN